MGFARNYNATIGTVATANQVFPLPAGIRKLVVDEDRPVTLSYSGLIVAHFNVVDADQITRREGVYAEDRVTKVRESLIFSREFRTTEVGAIVIADTISSLPRIANDPTFAVLDQVKPYTLMVLGVAKNMTLPDIIQGGLSPSFVQKYADLLMKAKDENRSSTIADMAVYESFGDIGGVH